MEKALQIVRDIQRSHPKLHVGGSLGLFLHGLHLGRFDKWSGDIDMTSPKDVRLDAKQYEVEEASFDDFDKCYKKDGIHIDIAIDPEQKPVKIFYDGFDYSVTPLERIIYAKCKYAMKGVEKHRQDIFELLGKEYIPEKCEDLPW